MVVFPSKEWMDEYCKALNQNKEFEQAGKGWGVEWNGDFIFQVEGIPIDKIDMEAAKKGLPKNVVASIQEQMEKYVVGGTGLGYTKLKDGKCLGAGLLKDLKEMEAGFIMSGPYENWKKLTKGELDAVRGVLSGRFKLQGDMSKIMRYMRASTIMTKTAATLKSEYLDEMFPKK